MAETMKQTVGTMLSGIERYNPDNLPTLERYVEMQSKENTYDLEANLAVLKLYQFNPHSFNVDITCQILLKALTNLPHADFILCKCLLSEKQVDKNSICAPRSDPKKPVTQKIPLGTKGNKGDFLWPVICKLKTENKLAIDPINQVIYLADILEQCDFQLFWARIRTTPELTQKIAGFLDSIRKFVCHVVGITFQTIERSHLLPLLGDIDEKTLQVWVKKYGWKFESNSLVFIGNQDENIKTKNISEKIDFESVGHIMAACR